MTSRLNHVFNEAVIKNETPETDKHKRAVPGTGQCTREKSVDYYEARDETDPFQDASSHDPLNFGQKEDIDDCITKMLKNAFDNELATEYKNELRRLTRKYIDLFQTSFSSGLAIKVKPLRINITQDAKPTRVRLRNHSQEQGELQVRFVDLLISAGMAHLIPSAAWACVSSLVPKAGTVRFVLPLTFISLTTLR